MDTLKPPKTDQQRTLKQNNAMHLYFEMVAQECKNSGITFSEYVRMRPQLDMPWTPHRVKEVWKTAQKHMYGTDSTAELTKKQIDVVYDVVNKALCETLGIENIPFPSFETLIEEKI